MARQVGRLQGRYAFCSFTNIHNADLLLVDWQVEVRTNFVDGTAFGDYWDVPVPIKYQWTGRARGRYAGLTSWLQAYERPGLAPQDIPSGVFHGYAGVIESPDDLIFEGACYVEMANFVAPESAMVEQEINLRGYGVPAFVDRVNRGS